MDVYNGIQSLSMVTMHLLHYSDYTFIHFPVGVLHYIIAMLGAGRYEEETGGNTTRCES